MPRKPSPSSANRRRLLAGVAVLATGRWWSTPLWRATLAAGIAQTPSQAAPATGWPTREVSPRFMRFSQGITEHADLDAVTGARIEAALRRQFPAFDDHLATLTGPGGTQPLPAAAALLAAAGDAGLRDLALAVVSAWYTGTVGAGKDAAVVSYAEALMYRTVADGQVVPTYCNYGPQWWTKAPPEAGVSAPEVSKAPPPATTGIPEPKNSTRP